MKARHTRRKSGTPSPITYSALESFFDQRNTHGYTGQLCGVDRRLLTVSPSIAGFLEVVHDQRKRLRWTPQSILTMFVQAAGTRAGGGNHRLERLRATVLCDWAVRSALPIWIENYLPRWGNNTAGPAKTAERLRRLYPLMYPAQFIDAIKEVHTISCCLLEEKSDRGTGAERAGHQLVEGRVRAALLALSETLPTWLSGRHVDDDEFWWVANRASQLLDVSRFSDDDTLAPVVVTMLRETLHPVFDVLVLLRSDDSQRSIAARCVWPFDQKQSGKTGAA